MKTCSLLALPRAIAIPLFSSFCILRDLIYFESVCSNTQLRILIRQIISDDYFVVDGSGNDSSCIDFIKWLSKCKVRVRRLNVKCSTLSRIKNLNISIFDKLAYLTIHVNAATEYVLSLCHSCLVTLFISGSCSSESFLSSILLKCNLLVSLTINSFSYDQPSTDISNSNADVQTDKSITSLSALSQLQDLSVHSSEYVGDALLCAILPQCSALVSLSIDNSPLLTDRTLTALSAHCHSVSVLSIKRCNAISDQGVLACAKGMSSVTEVSLTRCSQLSNLSVIAVVTAWAASLKKLDVSFCVLLTDHSIQKICQECKALRTLNLIGCSTLSSDCIFTAMRMIPNISF